MGTSVATSAAPLCKGYTGVCGGVEEIGVGFQQWCVAGSQANKEDRVRSVASAVQYFDQENPPYISTVLGFVGGASVNKLLLVFRLQRQSSTRG